MSGYRECRYTAQDGLSLYYRAYGPALAARTPVLCLSGLTRNSQDFHAVAGRLCADRAVICPDYRGRGRSEYDSDSANYRPETYLNDIRHLLAVTGLARVIVIGTSLGGLLAMGMGVAMPGALAAVVLNDVGPEIGSSGLQRILDYIGTDRPHRNWADAAQDMKSMFPALSLHSAEEWEAAARATWRERPDGLLHFDWDVRLAEPLRNGPPPPDLWPLFRSIARVPLLSVRGAISDVLSTETVDTMGKLHPDMKRVTVPDTGHVPSLVEPEAAQALDRFLSTL